MLIFRDMASTSEGLNRPCIYRYARVLRRDKTILVFLDMLSSQKRLNRPCIFRHALVLRRD